jgi:hypothetical protein
MSLLQDVLKSSTLSANHTHELERRLKGISMRTNDEDSDLEDDEVLVNVVRFLHAHSPTRPLIWVGLYPRNTYTHPTFLPYQIEALFSLVWSFAWFLQTIFGSPPCIPD